MLHGLIIAQTVDAEKSFSKSLLHLLQFDHSICHADSVEMEIPEQVWTLQEIYFLQMTVSLEINSFILLKDAIASGICWDPTEGPGTGV